MTTRIPSHQLSSGLYVSGRPEQLKERQPTMASRAVPYTGGDVKKSGELGKMFDIQVTDQANTKLPSRPSSSSQPNSGSVRSGSNSGPVKKTSGPLPLQPTGLITSGPIGSGPLSNRRSGQLDYSGSGSGSVKAGYGSAVTSLGEDVKVGFRVSRAVAWVVMVVVAMGVMVGAFLMVAVKKAVVLVAVAAVVGPLFIGMIWNCVWGRRGLLGFVKKYPDTELRGAIDGQYVKVTGKYVSDFYISDFRSGLRALVKAGYGAKVAPFVKPATVVNITKGNRDLSPSFLRWLADRNLSSDDRIMRLKEGYIKEGSTVSVMGVVRRHDNVLMIVPSTEPVSTGCQWSRCLLPTYVEGLILTCEDNQDGDVVPV
ncbi:ubiquitin-specific protease family C19-related protein [Citrus sinensis]|nr:ubiquitin-specific protease family C19-related protein [Citrus sinensis]